MGQKRLVALWVAAILVVAGRAVATEITGQHNGQLHGYDATSGAYDVPADSGGVPSATFNDNGEFGLYANGTTVSVTIEGDQFYGNFIDGLEVEGGAAVTITGGAFDDNGDEAVTVDRLSTATISGGEFLDNNYGLLVSGTIDLYGGQFGGNAEGDIAEEGRVPVAVFRFFSAKRDLLLSEVARFASIR